MVEDSISYCFDCRCRGESHKTTGKPCQDYSFSEATEGYAIAIVSDGHGGCRYYRSDVGSRLLCEVTARCLKEFAVGVPLDAFVGFGAVGIGEEMPSLLQQLFGAIVVGWRKAVMEHADHHPLSEAEQSIAIPKDEHEWEKTYGCTLLATLRTGGYWLAFQVGDGKCVAIRADGTPHEPIPWDDRCFLNKTTSICDTDALANFRCCYGSIDTSPVALFLGSDGIDDSFGEEENLYNFYMQLSKGFSHDGYDATVQDLQQSLPVMSKRGSQDDMSVAGIYDERIHGMSPCLIQWQIGRLEGRKQELSKHIVELWARILGKKCNGVDRDMAYSELIRYSQKQVEVGERIKKLQIFNR